MNFYMEIIVVTVSWRIIADRFAFFIFYENLRPRVQKNDGAEII